MVSQKTAILLIIFVLSLAMLSQVKVEAARLLTEDFASSNHLETYSSVVLENAKRRVSIWLQLLASGPSPRGSGH
ncbi:hypothetical protein K2173_018938 [Erythroxylum novogranatense]|uniref:Transmembrane protein n=1 Tax=Erythroxylum novogranatense TaxID=1862640 RepID=A0AAV8SSA7_9ROSI|nr:hypothetical protein K2173_018938 [Erythroxylum novogranatense]